VSAQADVLLFNVGYAATVWQLVVWLSQ